MNADTVAQWRYAPAALAVAGFGAAYAVAPTENGNGLSISVARSTSVSAWDSSLPVDWRRWSASGIRTYRSASSSRSRG